MSTSTMLKEYNSNISPKLKEIDIYLKTEEQPFNIDNTASVLDISKDELLHIMYVYDITSINISDFFTIMIKGSSKICRLFSRKLNCGLKTEYSPENISYIYDIDISEVYRACKKLNCYSFDDRTIKNILGEISIQSES